jgi:tetratricopeptide (TPR) repeat protein
MARRWLAGLLVLAAAGSAYVSGTVLERRVAARERSDQLLYLPNGKHLKVASLGQAPVLADMIYIWAIQYYSEYERADRFRYVEHVFGEVITELDPHYVDAYWLGALILIVEAGELEKGLALLDQGFAANPDKWILPYLAGWECWLAGQPGRAADYFDAAAATPGAPPTARRIRAAMVSRAGNLDKALVLWNEILEDPDSDPTSRAIAERKVGDLRVQIDLRDIQAAIERFRFENSRFPGSLEELQKRGYIRGVPRHPDDRDYEYDPRSGKVSAPEGRVLGESA